MTWLDEIKEHQQLIKSWPQSTNPTSEKEHVFDKLSDVALIVLLRADLEKLVRALEYAIETLKIYERFSLGVRIDSAIGEEPFKQMYQADVPVATNTIKKIESGEF